MYTQVGLPFSRKIVLKTVNFIQGIGTRKTHLTFNFITRAKYVGHIDKE